MKRLTALLAVISLLAIALPAAAAHDRNPSPKVQTYIYSLDGVANNDDASGWVRLNALPNGKIQVKVRVDGLAPNLPHAQHLHGIEDDGAFVPGACPTIADDGALGRPVDGLIDTLEGVGDYGFVRASLTTTGDTSAGSALAVARFPVADENGRLEYDRTFTPEDPRVWRDLGALEVVVHGVDLNNNGGYDFEFGASSLTDTLPLEATIPAVCGGPGN
ncbi:MAG: hypothetical protein ACRDU9_07755 [Acidimicrobiia bacterium]